MNKDIKEKAEYCLNCKIKPCSNKGCPLNNDIPEFIKALKEEKYEIFNLNEREVLKNIDLKEDNIILNKINVKENMPLIFYSNIMYYDNTNKTLPTGMDVNTDVLIDLKQYDMKLVSRKDFKIIIYWCYHTSFKIQ